MRDVLPDFRVDAMDIQRLQHLIAGDEEVRDDLCLFGKVERNGERARTRRASRTRLPGEKRDGGRLFLLLTRRNSHDSRGPRKA
jgi:hypothetical protein